MKSYLTLWRIRALIASLACLPGAFGQTSQTPAVTSLTPENAAGSAAKFHFTLSDNDGYQNISSLSVMIQAAGSPADSCAFQFSPHINRITLTADFDSPTASPGSDTILENAQCAILAAGVQVRRSGNEIDLDVPVIFKPAYQGPKNVYASVADVTGLQSGAGEVKTAFTVTTAPSVVLVTPDSGAGSTAQLFTYTIYNPTGTLKYLQSLTSTLGWSGFQSCHFYYAADVNQLSLATDNNFGSVGSGAVGAEGTLENGQCSIDLGGSSISTSGRLTYLRLPISFKSSYTGTLNLYAAVGSTSGVANPELKGTWTIPGNQPPQLMSIDPTAVSGTRAIFRYKYSDANGAANLHIVGGNFLASALDPAVEANKNNGCFTNFVPAQNWMNVRLNDGSQPGAAIGGDVDIENGQCIVHISQASFTRDGDTLTLDLPITFKSAYTGQFTVWQKVHDVGSNTGWISGGEYSVAGSN